VTHRKPLLWGDLEGQARDIEIHAREVIALKQQIEELSAAMTHGFWIRRLWLPPRR
jgi:ATP-dependent protease ClpP protease subunit